MAKSLVTYGTSISHEYFFRAHNPSCATSFLLFLPAAKSMASSICFRKSQILSPNDQNKFKRNPLVVYSSVQPGVPLPPLPPQVADKVERAMEMAEENVNVVEKTAEEVENVANQITDQLPESQKPRNVVISIKKLTEAADKDAHLVGNFVEEVEEVEIKVESFIDSVIDEAKESPKSQRSGIPKEVSQTYKYVNA